MNERIFRPSDQKIMFIHYIERVKRDPSISDIYLRFCKANLGIDPTKPEKEDLAIKESREID